MGNATFETIKELTISLTSRPDLIRQTELAIKTVTAQAHNSDEFPQDKVIVELSPVLNQASGAYELDISAIPFIRHRKILQLLDTVNNRELTHVEATDLFAEQFSKRTDVYYQAGLQVNIIAHGIETLRCVYLQKPDLLPDTYSSWIANERDDIIAYGAASVIQDLTGRKEERDSNRRLFLQGLQELKTNYIT